jgi:hypothetical protein
VAIIVVAGDVFEGQSVGHVIYRKLGGLCVNFPTDKPWETHVKALVVRHLQKEVFCHHVLVFIWLIGELIELFTYIVQCFPKVSRSVGSGRVLPVNPLCEDKFQVLEDLPV